jgi:hypothetical protein
MCDSDIELLAKDRAWKTVVRLATGILKRDCGKDAIEHARRYLHEAELDEHEQSIRLWKAVVDEIDKPGH